MRSLLPHPESISPLTARTQADRDLVALLFAGLVRNGPNGSVVPDLAARWSIADKGRTWTFELRDDAFWHDGQPVTAADVAFTIHTLQDPDYAGPRATSWAGVAVRAIGERTVRFTLDTPIGGSSAGGRSGTLSTSGGGRNPNSTSSKSASPSPAAT